MICSQVSLLFLRNVYVVLIWVTCERRQLKIVANCFLKIQLVSILENKKKNKGNLFDFLLYSSLSGYTLAQLGEDNVMNCQIDRNV